jgi:hypothetical protein
MHHAKVKVAILINFKSTMVNKFNKNYSKLTNAYKKLNITFIKLVFIFKMYNFV